MKHFLFVDGATNCAYSVYEVSDEDFSVIFPEPGQDIEFSSDLTERVGGDAGWQFIRRIYLYPVDKKRPLGIDGTVFHKLDYKRKFYPTKRESDLDASGGRMPLTSGIPLPTGDVQKPRRDHRASQKPSESK